jgi:D-3-phosphoglycerate dehydrogenase
VVVKEDLIESLKAGEIAGAAVDVFDPKPGPDDPLVALDNVLATPWAAFYTHESIFRMSMGAATEVATVLNGGKPKFPVNRIDGG